MPTFETLPRFEKDWKGLTSQQRDAFRKVVKECHPKAPTSRQPLDLLCREVEVFEEVERRLQPGRPAHDGRPRR